MAMAKPVVSTRLGAEGLILDPGREVLLEDDPEAFARAVLDLPSDAPRREAMGRAERETAVRACSRNAAVDKMGEILEPVRRQATQTLIFGQPLRDVPSNPNRQKPAY